MPIQELVIDGFNGTIIFQKDVTIVGMGLRDSSVIGGNKTITIQDSITWTAGTIGDGAAGRLILASTSTSTISALQFSGTIDGWTVINEGSLTWLINGTLFIKNSGRLENWNEFTVSGGGVHEIKRASPNDQGYFTNSGTVLQASGDLLKFDVDVSSCLGTWTVFANDIAIVGNTEFNSATIEIAAGRKLTWGASGVNITFWSATRFLVHAKWESHHHMLIR